MNDSIWYKVMHYGLEFLGLFYSNYRGFVVDNNDPEKLNRIKVVIPAIFPNDTVGQWVYPKNNWGGKNYGTNLLPQIKDMVWIEFEQGNTDYGIWSHAGYGEEEKPEEFSSPNIYGFKTPQGNIILINDEGDEEQILVKYKTNNEYIKISQDLLELESTLIKLGKDGDEWAVMGETLKTKLEQILYTLQQNQQFLATHTHPTAAPYAPTAVPIQSAQFTQVQSDLQQTYNELQEILSQTVKIDK